MKQETQYRPIAVITGASSGIGYALARVFAENGYDLLIAAEDSGIAESAQSLKAFGAEVDFIQVNLADFTGVERLYEKIKNSNKPVEAIAINAGVGVGGDFLDTELKKEMNMINLNVVSVVHLAKRMLRYFNERGEGKILFTSSIAGEMPGPHYAVYAATKAFVQSFAEAIRFEVKDKNIHITALQPGATDTNFFARAEMLHTKAGEGKKDDPLDVARDGFKALMANKDHVVGGSFMNKVQATVAKFVSEPVGAGLQGSSTAPTNDATH